MFAGQTEEKHEYPQTQLLTRPRVKVGRWMPNGGLPVPKNKC